MLRKSLHENIFFTRDYANVIFRYKWKYDKIPINVGLGNVEELSCL